MDETPDAFAYRCVPLTIANSYGWEIRCLHDFEAEWTGRPEPEAVVVRREEGAAIEVEGHFGSGILTFHSRFVLRTEPGYSLWVTGPPNSFKDAIQPLSAVVETNWMPFSFTMNWKFTRPNHPVRFARGEPYCFFFPVKMGEVEDFTPRMAHIDEVPELKRQYAIAQQKRTFIDYVQRFKDEGRIQCEFEAGSLRPMLYQGWYSKGQMPDGSPRPEHRKRIRPQPFDPSAIPDTPPPPPN